MVDEVVHSWTSRRPGGAVKALGVVWKRMVIIMYLRKVMASLLMASYINSRALDDAQLLKIIAWHKAVLNAHIAVVTLPALMSRNFWQIRTNRYLHAYFLGFTAYRTAHKAIYRKLMQALIDYDEWAFFKTLWAILPAACQVFTPQEFSEDPKKHFQATTEFLSHHVNTDQADPKAAVAFINQHFHVDCPDLDQALINPTAVLLLNPLHDADFFIISTNILLRRVYQMLAEGAIDPTGVRPYLLLGTSNLQYTLPDQTELLTQEWLQWDTDELILRIEKE